MQKLLLAAALPDDGIRNILQESRNSVLDSLAGEHESEDLSGERIGHWRVEAPLARGGLATVYVAHRDDGQYEQKAALKVLRRGLDTDDIVSRFLAERQILSSLDHPAIAKILDGGVMDDGRPYLVLEFVEGCDITRYCEEFSVSTRDRIGLVINVLRALQHAHNHLVVHRDIKPSNVMVSNGGHITVLDFGIAKLLDPAALPGASALTRTGVALLTPQYGSPEQHARDPVTTASDIYQVGGIMFELFAGTRPPDASARNAFTVISPPSKLASRPKEIKGDLDAIVLKAMQHDPGMRYQSATEMIADLENYLDGKPVHARPDTLTYRAYKLIRRRPLLLPALLTLVSATSGYIVTLSQHNHEIRVEQERAEAAQAFMVDLLGSASPYGANDRERGKDMRVIDALEVGVQRLHSGDYGGDEKLRAALLAPIADAYWNLSEMQISIQLRLEALAIEEMVYGEISEPVIVTTRELGHQFRTIGDYDEAGRYYARQLELAQQLFSANSAEIAVAMTASGLHAMRRGEQARAIELLENSVASLERQPENNAADLIDAIKTLTRARIDIDIEDSLLKLVRAMQLADDVFGAQSPLAGVTRTQYATSLTIAGDYQLAERYFDEAIKIYEARLGRDHGATLIALINYGRLYYAMGDFGDAELIFREVYSHYLRLYGAQQGGTAESGYELGKVLTVQGHYSEGIAFLENARRAYLAVLGEDNERSWWPMVWIAASQEQMGEPGAAAVSAALAAEKLGELAPNGKMASVAHCLVQNLGQTPGARGCLAIPD